MREDKLSQSEIEVFKSGMEGIKDFLRSYEATSIEAELQKDNYVSREYLREKVSGLLRFADRLDYITKDNE